LPKSSMTKKRLPGPPYSMPRLDLPWWAGLDWNIGADAASAASGTKARCY
jgi:hypothetical protein